MRKFLDSPQQLVQSARHFFSGTLITQVSSKARDILMARVFGTGPAISALAVVLNVVSILRRFLGKGVVHYIFIPQFEAIRKSDPQRAFRFFRDLVSTLAAILLTLVLILEVSIWGALHFELCPTYNRVLELSALIIPSVIFICLFGLNSALLSCERSFFLTTIAPVGFNLVWIAAVWLVDKFELEKDVAVSRLAITVGIAAFVQWLLTAPSIVRLLKNELSHKWWKDAKCFSQDLKKVATPLILGCLGVGAMQINTLVDNLFAYAVDPSGASYLLYSIKVYQIPLDLFAIALSLVLLPSLSRALEQQNPQLYRSLLDNTLRRGMYIMVPCSIGLIVLGSVAINLLYNHGKFTDLSVYETIRCLAGYSLGLLPQTLVLSLIPAFYALGDYRSPIIVTLAALIVNTFLDALFIYGFGWGVASVAIATSIAGFVNVSLLIYMLHKKFHFDLVTTEFITCGKKIFIGAGIAGFVTLFIGYYFLGDYTIDVLIGSALPSFPKNFTDKSLQAFALMACFAGVFCLMNKWLKIKQTIETHPLN
ncbi:MAG: hypothetical protein K0S74_1203 [Chlamydiales bacterium]|jgi:putative peptidoglycan lipid II flippase|nr:hypothetical protein [Chlamydiales bacterium]